MLVPKKGKIEKDSNFIKIVGSIYVYVIDRTCLNKVHVHIIS